MPRDFPRSNYESFYGLVIAKAVREKVTEDWKRQFIGAWKAVAYRFRACDKHQRQFNRSISRNGSAPREMEAYYQDHEFFCAFAAGLASLESLYYGLFACGALIMPSTFPFTLPSDYQKARPEATVKGFNKAFTGERITASLSTVWQSPERADWELIRNVLVHRVIPGRIIYMSTSGAPPPPPNEFVVGSRNIPIDVSTIGTRSQWLAASLNAILTEAVGPFSRYLS